MKTWELKHAGKVVARIEAVSLDAGQSNFLWMVHDENKLLLATIFLNPKLTVVESAVPIKSSPTET